MKKKRFEDYFLQYEKKKRIQSISLKTIISFMSEMYCIKHILFILWKILSKIHFIFLIF